MVKFKITNVCERQVQESLPGVFRFKLEPEESVIVSDTQDYTASQIVQAIKLARGLRGEKDLSFEPVLEDKELVKVLEKLGK